MCAAASQPRITYLKNAYKKRKARLLRSLASLTLPPTWAVWTAPLNLVVGGRAALPGRAGRAPPAAPLNKFLRIQKILQYDDLENYPLEFDKNLCVDTRIDSKNFFKMPFFD